MSEEQNVTQEEQVSTETQTQEAQPTDNPTPAFEIPTEAQEFVGEGKKYKSAEDALKSVPHAQQHIQTLEAELAQVKEELSKRQTTQELIDELKSDRQAEPTAQQPEVDADSLEQLVQATLDKREQQRSAKTNADSVASKFTAKFGDSAEANYNQLAKDNGLTIQQLNNLAATSPSAVLRLAGLDGKAPTNVAKPTGTVNTQALQGTDTSELSARVPKGASTKDLVKAWKAAGEKVKSQLT
ncbi:hypothetical protein MTPG_00014 [Methylophilales phage HIM624-A]|nr:hypothetical protein MTPG_00014 [Methylophilales phage HIM624-A]